MDTVASQVPIGLRQLAAFREVARCGGVSAAARALYLSQPAVTQAVSALEGHLGTALFERHRTGMILTAAGRILHERAERALEHLRDRSSDVLHRGTTSAGAARVATAAQLEALIAVVGHGTFAAAARAAGLSRPALHRAARALEASLGIPLFERTSFGIRANREGEVLANCARLAFAELAQARAEIAAMSGHDAGCTVIGVMPLARSLLAPKAVLEFTTAYPSHTIVLLDGTYESLLAALRSGAADLLIGALREPAPASDVSEERLLEDPLAIIVRTGHPLASAGAPSVATLARYQWIAPRARSPLRAHFEALFASAGLRPPVAPINCNSLVAARALLLDSDRVMLLSAHQIHHEQGAGMLVALPHPLGRVVRPIGLTLRRGWRPTRAQAHLLDTIRSVAARIDEGIGARGRRRSSDGSRARRG